jgi:hypothetical protein
MIRRTVFAGLLMLAFGLLPLPAQALTISPVRIEVSGDPGETVRQEIKLTNTEREDTTFYISYANFDSKDETGTPTFIPGDQGLATWIRSPQSVTIKTGESKTVPFTIEIPRGAEPGGYFSVIFASRQAPDGDGQVALGEQVGSLILLRVNGDIATEGGLLEYGTKNKQQLFTELPITFYYRFQNNGEDRVQPEGVITIKNTFGLTSKVLSANPTRGSVLPQSIRRFETSWINGPGKTAQDPFAQVPAKTGSGFWSEVKYQWHNFAFGLYRAHLEIAYGSVEQRSSKASLTFFVLPWQLLTVIIPIIVAALATVWFLLRQYNHWIIRRAQGGSGKNTGVKPRKRKA